MTVSTYPASFNLADLNGENGFVINGIVAGDYSGCSVASAGDINGDDIPDLVIGAYQASASGRTNAGQSYVMFGKRTPWTSPLELSSLNGTNGFIINGITVNDYSGYSVTSVGDINGDGVTDLLIGAFLASPSGRTNAGQSYVMFGKRTPWTSPLELSSLNGVNGFIINGITVNDYSGISVASAGDINGDDIPDLVIGAYRASPSGRSAAGQSYVVFGKRTAWTSPLELSSLNGVNGFVVNGIAATDYSGYSVTSVGDINGDGVTDLLIGAFLASPNGRNSAGQSYVVFGKRTPWTSPLELSSLNGVNGVIVNGIVANDRSGYKVASAGDINGDAVAALVIGAYGADLIGRTNVGQSYIVFGKRTPWTSPLELSSLNGANGFIVNGIAANDNSGVSVALAGDINGDGVTDLLIGANDADPSGRSAAGQSYVVFGKRTAWASPLELSSLNGANGFIVNGIAAGDRSGSSVASAGDINQDGVADLVIGAYVASPSGRNQTGQSYIVFGDIPIPIINNQLTISAGQSVILNSNALFAFTRNYTGEVYFNVSNVQNGYFQLLNNIGIAITQFTQTQLTNNVVRFVSTSSVAPSYFMSASTGIGNAIPPAPQAANIIFSLLSTTSTSAQSSIITSTTNNAPTLSSSTNTPSSSATSTSSSLSISSTQSSTPTLASSTSASSTISLSSSNNPLTDTPTMSLSSISSASSSSTPISQASSSSSTSATLSALSSSFTTISSSSIALSSSQSPPTSAITSSSSTPTISLLATSTSSPLVNTNTSGSSGGVSSAIIAAAAGAGGGVVVLAALILISRHRKQKVALTQEKDQKNMMQNIDNPLYGETPIDEVIHTQASLHATPWTPSLYAVSKPSITIGGWSSHYAAGQASDVPKANAWSSGDYAAVNAAAFEVPWDNNAYTV